MKQFTIVYAVRTFYRRGFTYYTQKVTGAKATWLVVKALRDQPNPPATIWVSLR